MKIIKNQNYVNYKLVKIEDIANIVRGGSPRPIEKYITKNPKDMPWLKIKDATSVSKYIEKTKEYIRHDGVKHSRIVQPGDFIVSNSATPGIPRIMKIQACIHDGWLLLNDIKINKDYLFYIFHTVKKSLENQGQGSIFKNLSKDILNNFQIKITENKDQQKKIAYVLSMQEEQIETIKRLIKNVEKRNQYYSEKLLSGEIKINDQTSELEFYQSYSNFDNYLTVDQLVSYLPKSKIKTGEANKENINKFPFFNCSKEQNLYLDYSICSNENIFLSTGGSANVHYYNGEAAYSTDVLAITNTKEVECYYLYNLFNINIKLIEKCFQGSGLKHLNKKDFKKIKLPIPTKDEQKKISSFLVKKEQELFTLKKIQQKEEKRFQWMLDNLLSGEYEVIDED
ncbi:TPA: restriction endonuclease subunit S [Escherichia coli]|nr:restriction endonuclease subunit S [Escherichia coli]